MLRALATLVLSASAAAQAPSFYCTSNTSLAGCVAELSTTNPLVQPVSGAGDYEVIATQVPGFKPGLLVLGVSGQANLPLTPNGILCVAPPLGRGPIQFSRGTSPIECTGQFSRVVNDAGATHVALDRGPGTSNWIQYWARDPAAVPPCCIVTTEAVEVTFQ